MRKAAAAATATAIAIATAAALSLPVRTWKNNACRSNEQIKQR